MDSNKLITSPGWICTQLCYALFRAKNSANFIIDFGVTITHKPDTERSYSLSPFIKSFLMSLDVFNSFLSKEIGRTGALLIEDSDAGKVPFRGQQRSARGHGAPRGKPTFRGAKVPARGHVPGRAQKENRSNDVVLDKEMAGCRDRLKSDM